MTKCSACRRDFESAHIQNDHRVPRSIGGNNSPSNRQELCINCHQRKNGLEVSLFQFYTETQDIFEWFQLAFQDDTKKIETWITELEMKTCHFREVLRGIQNKD